MVFKSLKETAAAGTQAADQDMPGPGWSMISAITMTATSPSRIYRNKCLSEHDFSEADAWNRPTDLQKRPPQKRATDTEVDKEGS